MIIALNFPTKSLGFVYKICFVPHRYVDAGTLMNNYAHIFDLLTRLRQVSTIVEMQKYTFVISTQYCVIAICQFFIFGNQIIPAGI